MFDNPFPFTKFNYQKKFLGELSFIEHVYKFKGSEKKDEKNRKGYIVFAEQYDYNVYAVKFCTRERKNYSDRFNILSNHNECNRVLTTVGFVMRQIVKDNPYASFIFVGSPLPNEEENNSKRYRLYTSIVQQLVSPLLFEQRKYEAKSACLMLNRDNHQVDLLENIEKVFQEFYDL